MFRQTDCVCHSVTGCHHGPPPSTPSASDPFVSLSVGLLPCMFELVGPPDVLSWEHLCRICMLSAGSLRVLRPPGLSVLKIEISHQHHLSSLMNTLDLNRLLCTTRTVSVVSTLTQSLHRGYSGRTHPFVPIKQNNT